MNTQEKKELLLKDLCARLPYGVICADIHADEKFTNKWDVIAIDGTYGNEFSQVCISNCEEIYGYKIPVERIKPYLLPLSNMTEEQYKEWCDLEEEPLDEILTRNANGEKMSTLEHHLLIAKSLTDSVNYCYKNHFDVNGLIPMGLANDATNLNIY